jgi:hypothetical protein
MRSIFRWVVLALCLLIINFLSIKGVLDRDSVSYYAAVVAAFVIFAALKL